MPKNGFKSITVSDAVYERFCRTYEADKENMISKGVNSIAGYVSHMLEETMRRENTFAKYQPKMEKVSADSDRIVLKDNRQNRIVEVAFRGGGLLCLLCEAGDCAHVGFCWSLPEAYGR